MDAMSARGLKFVVMLQRRSQGVSERKKKLREHSSRLKGEPFRSNNGKEERNRSRFDHF